jgi:hypothetical protein
MKKSFGSKLRAARLRVLLPPKGRRMSQRAAAELLGVSLRLYEYWEADDANHLPLILTQEGALARFYNLAPPKYIVRLKTSEVVGS